MVSSPSTLWYQSPRQSIPSLKRKLLKGFCVWLCLGGGGLFYGNIYAAEVPTPVHLGKTSTPPNTSVTAPSISTIKPLLEKYACLACHSVKSKIIGPSYLSVIEKVKNTEDPRSYLTLKIKNGGQGVWGTTAMPAPPGITESEAAKIADWLLAGANME